MEANIQILCTFLEQLLTGSIQAKDAKPLLNTLSALSMTELDELYGNLFHYIDDTGIRDKDPAYRKLQESEMMKLIGRLKNGNFAMANAVTFIERT